MTIVLAHTPHVAAEAAFEAVLAEASLRRSVPTASLQKEDRNDQAPIHQSS